MLLATLNGSKTETGRSCLLGSPLLSASHAPWRRGAIAPAPPTSSTSSRRLRAARGAGAVPGSVGVDGMTPIGRRQHGLAGAATRTGDRATLTTRKTTPAVGHATVVGTTTTTTAAAAAAAAAGAGATVGITGVILTGIAAGTNREAVTAAVTVTETVTETGTTVATLTVKAHHHHHHDDDDDDDNYGGEGKKFASAPFCVRSGYPRPHFAHGFPSPLFFLFVPSDTHFHPAPAVGGGGGSPRGGRSPRSPYGPRGSRGDQGRGGYRDWDAPEDNDFQGGGGGGGGGGRQRSFSGNNYLSRPTQPPPSPVLVLTGLPGDTSETMVCITNNLPAFLPRAPEPSLARSLACSAWLGLARLGVNSARGVEAAPLPPAPPAKGVLLLGRSSTKACWCACQLVSALRPFLFLPLPFTGILRVRVRPNSHSPLFVHIPCGGSRWF